MKTMKDVIKANALAMAPTTISLVVPGAPARPVCPNTIRHWIKTKH